MTNTHAGQISQELKIPESSVLATIKLLDEGATVPFIARYRKEVTGTLDEVAITSIRDMAVKLAELDKRRSSIFDSLKERELLTDELAQKLNDASNLSELEDIYLPFRPKRRTKATVAREKGLEKLAQEIFKSSITSPKNRAVDFISEEKGVGSADEALAGARDIISEWMSEDESARKKLRKLWSKDSRIDSKVAKGKDAEGEKFKDYFEWTETVAKIPSHRILAMFRGESEGVLKLAIKPNFDDALNILDDQFIRIENKCAEQLELAVEDAYKRLLAPSMETELRHKLKARADEEAIQVFASNLFELLMAPPLGESAVLALDPGFRTGCKVVCLNKQGGLLHHDVIYPNNSGGNSQSSDAAAKKVLNLVKEHKVEAVAIGNGTASRETEDFLKSIDFEGAGLEKPQIIMVNESGASIYSASKVAREEFPDHDITVRGAVSIGRRLMDPLAELVKLDPKSIGVGQYQHDVDQPKLQSSLDDTVMSCVNGVGVELNTASRELLSYVSGLGSQLAQNVVVHRQENGAFTSRAQLKKVKRLGPKAFEQCAGFLRIRNAKNPLDTSGVHPESYKIVEKMAKALNCKVDDLVSDNKLREAIVLADYVTDSVGLPTLNDILKELEKPGRDPREKLEVVEFAKGINKISDLKEGMRLPGIITNVTNFGAFVDIGVHQDGLVHISELADRFVKDPTEVVKVQQKVDVLVLKVEESRKRISLSMKR